MSTAEWYTVFKLEKCTSSLLVTAHNFLQACFYFVYLWIDHVVPLRYIGRNQNVVRPSTVAMCHDVNVRGVSLFTPTRRGRAHSML